MWCQRESQISETRENNNFERVSPFLYISLPSTAWLHVKMPDLTFCEGRKQAMAYARKVREWSDDSRNHRLKLSIIFELYSGWYPVLFSPQQHAP